MRQGLDVQSALTFDFQCGAFQCCRGSSCTSEIVVDNKCFSGCAAYFVGPRRERLFDETFSRHVLECFHFFDIRGNSSGL